MSQINLGSVINAPNNFKDQFISPYPGIEARRYLAYARLTSVAQNVLPLYIPSQQKDVADRLARMSYNINSAAGTETIYRIEIFCTTPVIGINGEKVKLTFASAPLSGVNVQTIASNRLNPAALAGTVPGTAIANAPSGQGDLQLQITNGAEDALGTGLRINAAPSDAEDVAIAKEFGTDKPFIIVDICTFKNRNGFHAGQTTDDVINLSRQLYQRCFKGI